MLTVECDRSLHAQLLASSQAPWDIMAAASWMEWWQAVHGSPNACSLQHGDGNVTVGPSDIGSGAQFGSVVEWLADDDLLRYTLDDDNYSADFYDDYFTNDTDDDTWSFGNDDWAWWDLFLGSGRQRREQPLKQRNRRTHDEIYGCVPFVKRAVANIHVHALLSAALEQCGAL
jgi:hypothetical protein